MKERLKRVIDKIIIPHYPSSIEYTINVEENKELRYNITFDKPIRLTITKYTVVYFFPDQETMDKYYLPISEDTEGLFDMLGHTDNESIDVIGRRPAEDW